MTKLFSREWRNSSRYPLTITTLCLAILLAGPITVAYLVQAFQIEAFAQQEKTSKEAVITAESVRPHIEFLADDRFEGRGGGYRGEEKAAEYIARQFRKIGLTPAANMNGKPRSYFQGFRFHPRHPVVPWEMLRSRNVLGMIEGDDPNLKNEVVVIGAHYDGQGRTGQADPLRLPASDPNLARDEIWNSANDNAVSVASIIEIARAIKKGNTRTKRTLLFVAFGAEEHGMAGSMYYVRHPVFPLRRHVAMINLEKLGRSPEKPLSVTGAGSSPAWPEVFKAAQERTSTKVATGNPYAFPESDHYPFAASRIPAIMFWVPAVLTHISRLTVWIRSISGGSLKRHATRWQRF